MLRHRFKDARSALFARSYCVVIKVDGEFRPFFFCGPKAPAPQSPGCHSSQISHDPNRLPVMVTKCDVDMTESEFDGSRWKMLSRESLRDILRRDEKSAEA